MSTIASIAKFRPVLSSSQILHIIKLCKADASQESIEILIGLSKFEWQIRNDAVTPAYTIKPRESLSSSLGFGESNDPGAVNFTNSHDAVDPTTLYQIWLTEPESLTIKQIAAVRAWRYENNKMSMDEEKLFEKEILGVA